MFGFFLGGEDYTADYRIRVEPKKRANGFLNHSGCLFFNLPRPLQVKTSADPLSELDQSENISLNLTLPLATTYLIFSTNIRAARSECWEGHY